MSPLLRATNISKSFAGVQALLGVSFELRAGEVHALVGENGAGKSTLTKIMTGAHQAVEGILEVNGRVIETNDPVISRASGIAVIHQQPALFPDLTVAENIALGLEAPGWWRRVRWRQRRRRARELLDRAGAAIDPDAVAQSLTMPEQQLVEIARALGADERILILDEPTASLSEREVERLFRMSRDLRGQGVGMIYISHRLEELFQVADRVTVLRDAPNISLAILKKIASLGWLDTARERSIATSFVQRLGIKTASIDASVGSLSGGNQQKVALARWLVTEPAVLILDEPTQGVDVGAKAEIHRLMGELADKGLAIVMTSSEMPEILGMSDRIAVMCGATIMDVVDRSEATQEKLLSLALGHKNGTVATDETRMKHG